MAEEKIIESLKDAFCRSFNEKSKKISRIPLHQLFIEIKRLLQPDPKSHAPPLSLTKESLESLIEDFKYCKNLSRRNYKDDQYTEQELVSINKRRMKLNQMREKLSEAKSTQKQKEGASEKTEEEATQLSTRSVDPEKVFGFDGKVKAVEKLLLKEESENQLKALGMVGMKGIGKTTLCKVLFNKPEVKSHFLPRIWICMSRREQQESDHRFVIVKRLLNSLGANKEILNPHETDDQGLALAKLVYALNLKLRGKRYLIVLDGAEENEDWYQDLHLLAPQGIGYGIKWGDRLAYGLPKEHGGAVIVTCRSEEVAEKMIRKENLYSLLPLSDTKSCWSIFKREGFKDKPVNEVLKNELAKEEFKYEVLKNELAKEEFKNEQEKEKSKNEPEKEESKNEEVKKEPEKEEVKNEPEKERIVMNELAKVGEVKLKELKEELKKDIKRESAGVPLAAKMLGEIFYQKNKEKINSKSSQTPKEAEEEEDSKTQKQKQE